MVRPGDDLGFWLPPRAQTTTVAPAWPASRCRRPAACRLLLRPPDAARWLADPLAGALFRWRQEEAIACFERAIEADPSCAMAHWGVAYCHGPNYNFHALNGYYIVSQQESGYPSMKCAYDAIQRAAAIAKDPSSGITDVEKDLIEALQLLYVWPISSYASELGVAHSKAMRAVHEKYPADADVSFVFADSMMTLHPWQLWDLKTGEAVALVPELQGLLSDSLEAAPNHPGLCHLWIHLLEMSPTPALALEVCDRLRNLSPDNPHLCHMPSHIDVLVGHCA
jgi:hypothetical protein